MSVVTWHCTLQHMYITCYILKENLILFWRHPHYDPVLLKKKSKFKDTSSVDMLVSHLPSSYVCICNNITVCMFLKLGRLLLHCPLCTMILHTCFWAHSQEVDDIGMWLNAERTLTGAQPRLTSWHWLWLRGVFHIVNKQCFCELGNMLLIDIITSWTVTKTIGPSSVTGSH